MEVDDKESETIPYSSTKHQGRCFHKVKEDNSEYYNKFQPSGVLHGVAHEKGKLYVNEEFAKII